MDDGPKLNSQFQILANSLPSITTFNNNNYILTWDSSTNALILSDNGTIVSHISNIPYATSLSVISLNNDNFVVTYIYSTDVCAQIRSSNGTILKPQFSVNTFIYGDMAPSISSVSTGNFMIVWQSRGQDISGGSDYGIYGQSFTSSGAKIGTEFRVNTYFLYDQSSPSIASLTNDNYIVTWQSNNQDESGSGIYGQILDSTGNKIGNEFKLNTFTTSDQQSPSVSSLKNNNFVVVWNNNDGLGDQWDIFGNLYQSDGMIIGFNTCPLNCQSCDFNTNCITCNPNFKIQKNGLCGCFDGLYLDISGSTCISKLFTQH